jgi:hypothetical protein
LTAAVDMGSYVISPASSVGLNITDTTPSGSGYLVQISYDAGATWQTVATNAPLGGSSYDPLTDFPAVTPTTGALIQVANNDTLLTAETDPFNLTPDAVQGSSQTLNPPNSIQINVQYASDGAGALVTGGDLDTSNVTCDTTGGNEPITGAGVVSGSTLQFDFADPLSPSGTLQVNDLGTTTFDRPGATFTPPQSFPFP